MMSAKGTRVLIVDDERPARRRLRRLLSTFPEVEILGEAADAEEAAEAIDALEPDLVFLDIRMPAGTGFDALARARHRPWVVFVTAYDQYALKAFETDSLDYLLKPVTEEQLSRCIEKMTRMTMAGRSSPLLQESLERVSKSMPGFKAVRLKARRGTAVEIIPIPTIVYFAAQDKYTLAYTQEGKEYTLDQSLRDLERMLPEHYLRLHRRYLVSADCIRRVQPTTGGRYLVRLADIKETVLRTSRSGAQIVRETLLNS